MSFVITPPEPVTLPVRGTSDRFPVRRVYCVGRNYAAHAVEMGFDPDRHPPFFFQKNPDNLNLSGEFPYPTKTSDVHHEIELLVALSKGGSNIPVADAMDCVYGYAVALDMTRRDLQGKAKETGRPWETGKAVDHSGPTSELVAASDIGHPTQGAIWLKVDGEMRQEGDINQLIWKIPEMINYLSELFELAPGDVIFTGTPSGVGPVTRGSVMHGHIDGIGDLNVVVT